MNEIKSTPLLIKEIDKANHAIVGMIIYCIAAYFIHPILALGVVVIIATLKEVRDQIVYKGFNTVDLLYTVAGAIPTFILTLLKW